MNLEEIKQAQQELLDRYALIYQKLDLMGISSNERFYGLSLESLTDNKLQGRVVYPSTDLLFSVSTEFLEITDTTDGYQMYTMYFYRELFDNWETLASDFSKMVQDKLRKQKQDKAWLEQQQEIKERAQLQNLIKKYGVPET